MRLIILSASLALAIAIAGPVSAQEYWSGGVGIESRETAPKDMNTSFEFFDADGQYVMNVDVRISEIESGDRVFDRTVRGPWLMVNLSDGHYRIEATRPSTREVERVLFRVEGGKLPMMGLRYSD